MSDSKTARLAMRKDVDCAADLDKGEFCYARRDNGSVKWLHFWPRDCPIPLSAAIAPQHNGSNATWTLSGSEDAPTLHPSVDAVGIWHGWVRDGEATR